MSIENKNIFIRILYYICTIIIKIISIIHYDMYNKDTLH